MLLAGWANWPEMASVRVARLEPKTVVVLLEVVVVVARLDNSGLTADAAVAVVVDGAVAEVWATISSSVSGAWLEVARMLAVAAAARLLAVSTSTARLLVAVAAAVTVAVLKEAAADARLESPLVVALLLSVLDMNAMEADTAASFASRFSALLSFFCNSSRCFPNK